MPRLLFLAALVILGITGCSNARSSSQHDDAATTYAYSMLAPGQNGSTIICARIVLDAVNQA